MADESTTDAAVDSGVSQDAQPAETESQQTADTPKEPATDAKATASDEGQTQTEDDSSESIADWARKKGLPLSEKPTENELKLAKMQREAEQKMHQTSQRSSELEDAYRGRVDKLAEDNPEITPEQARLAKIELDVAVEKFFRANPDAAKFEQQMAKLVQDNPARANLPLDDLFTLAKSETSADIKKAGAKEALQSLAAKQKAASPTPSASTQEFSDGGVTREQVAQRVAAGDVDWIRKHSKEIDALASG